MKSPFAIFRKHARVLTVVLTGLAMFAFIVMDQMQSNPQMFPVILAALLLGGAFWILGRPAGHANEYGIAGMLLGIILMVYVIPRFTGPGAAVQLSIGSLSDKDVNNHMRRLQIANQFVYQAQSKTGRQPQGGVFGFGGDPLDSAAMARILDHEADQLGIRLSDAAVNEFLMQMTDTKLTPKQFREIRRNMRISESELFDILREQLRANMAFQMLVPQEFTAPSQFWEYYQRLNVKQEIKVTTIPVSAFVAEETPGDQEISAYFEKYRTVPRRSYLSPEPAFMQPRKIGLAYLQIDYDDVRARLEKSNPVTKEEIEAFYEENKAIRYREMPAFDQDIPPFESPDTSAADEPIDPVLAPLPGAEPKENAPAEKNPAEKKGTPEKEKTPPTKPEPAKPEEAGAQTDGGQFSVEDDPKADADAKPADEKDKTPADNADTEEKPPVVERQDNGDQPGANDQPTVAGNPVLAPVPVNYLPLDEELSSQIRDELMNARVLAELQVVAQQAAGFMREVGDDYIAHGMRDEGEPTAEEQAQRAGEVAERAQEYARQHGLRYVELALLGPEELSERGDRAAELWNEIQGADAEPTSEDREVLNYLIVQASHLRVIESSSQPEQVTVLQSLFGSDSDRLYARETARDPLSNNHYVYWKLADKQPEVPELDDPGIREQVVEALKEMKARKPARERAVELVEEARQAIEAGQTLEEALQGKTVTGEPESVELTVLDTGESFSWLTIPTAQSPAAFLKPPPALSSIAAVEKAGNEFMQVAFNELKVGDVGVAPNADHSAFHIIQVKSRTPSNAGGLQAFRNNFMQESLFGSFIPQLGAATSTYYYLTQQSQSALSSGWRQKLLEKYEYRRREVPQAAM